ncbi:expressed unknown protein [Seminavis robusta]|uniref:Uncharacterized protein n=1 Tax=Seminavis robusta TaxID=568900 RepID=A0A9N8EMN6_9STRA|nr:expressed unknown protein [Seminavis robusta]|eukprot:Sro1186_g250280.1 n/a (77) ;mRNA; r:12783-13146
METTAFGFVERRMHLADSTTFPSFKKKAETVQSSFFNRPSIHGDELAGAKVIFELFIQRPGTKTMDMDGTVVAIQA